MRWKPTLCTDEWMANGGLAYESRYFHARVASNRRRDAARGRGRAADGPRALDRHELMGMLRSYKHEAQEREKALMEQLMTAEERASKAEAALQASGGAN